MACTKETVKPSGLNIWSSEAVDSLAPAVDIIAVQGLGSHEFYTWVKRVPSEDADKSERFRDRARFWKGKKQEGKDVEDDPREVMWIRDLLVPIFKDARIATYSYKSDWSDREVKTSLRQCAERFLYILTQHRQQAAERRRPLVLIGHSLGSLVIQQALVTAAYQQDFVDLRLSVAGIIFLGGPLQGSNAAIFEEWLAQLLGRDSNLSQALRKDSSSLYNVSRDFWASYTDWDSVCFYENREADYGLLKTQVVSPKLASLLGKRIISLNTDHSGLNKFGGENDENFNLVLLEIRRMVENGPSIVAERYRAKEFSTTSYGNVHWMVPRTTNALFTGRSELLLRIQKAIYYDQTSSSDRQKRFVITGLGGQGKSEICLRVASKMRQEFWGVFWVDASNASTAEIDFIAIAKLLGQSVESIYDALRVLASIKQTWLLILDNADDPNVDYQAYFPSGKHGAILMTSRVPDCKRYSLEQFEALEGLEEEDSKELLLKAADIPQESWPSYSSQALKVVQLLGSHTLALIQAGAYIARGYCQLHEYPKVYQRQQERLLQYRPEQAQSRYHNAYATFEASAKVLEQSESEAAKDALCLLTVLSMLDSAVLPLQIFQSAWDGGREALRTSREETSEIDTISRNHALQLPGFVSEESSEWDPFRLIEASSKLVSLSLVIRHDLEGSSELSMHPLIHAWAKDRQDLEQQQVAWVATGCVLALSRTNPTMWRTQERRLLPHIQSYLDIKIGKALLFRSEGLVVPILLKCGWTLLDMRQDSRLSYLLEDIFTGLNKNPEEPSKESLPLYDLQARSLSNMGEHKSAVKLLEQVVAIRKTKLAETHPDRLASQHNLARAYQANGQVTEAVKLLEQVVTIRKKTLAETHPDRLASQAKLASIYQANGQVTEAVNLLEQVVTIRKKTLAETHPDRLASQAKLASIYQANGQVTEAVNLLEQVVAIQAMTLAEMHPDRLASQDNLASAYQANGQVTEAVNLLEQVVKIQATTLAETHPDRLASQDNLASAYQANGRVTEAVNLLEQVVKIQATTLAETHPDRLASQDNLASAYQANGRVTEAINLLEQVVAIQATTLAKKHPDRLASQHNLASAYLANGRVTEAVKLLEQVVVTRTTTLAETHPGRLASLYALAIAYEANGQVKEAIVLLELVVKIRKKTLAPDHPDRLTSQHALTNAYEANGQVKEASGERMVKTEEREFANSDSGYASGTCKPWNTTYTFSESKLSGVAEASEFQEHVGLDYVADASDLPNIGLYDKDTAYSPSETPSLPPLRSRIYIDDLASQLFNTIASRKPDQETLNRVSRELPDLLRAFSLKVGYRANPAQCHVAYFLHKYRRHIQQSFEDMFPLEPVSKADVFDSTDTGGYKITRFFEGLGLAVDPPQEEDSEYQDLPPALADRASSAGSDHNGDMEDDVEPPEPMPYRDSVLNSPAFDWLITTLLTEVNLTRQRADVMRSIRSQILGTLPSLHEVSRKNSSTEYRATFEIDWDPLSFVKDQKYQESPDQAIERSITLTGSPEDAQALTTGQYLAQTWPASGDDVMRIVAEVMRNTDHYASGTLPDGTELQARIDGGKFTVHATGIGDSLAEVAQQFAWLGAALRPSPFESGIAICSPAIHNLSLKNVTPRDKSFDSEPCTEISCIIEFDIQEPLSGGQRAGHCWHSMFRNPVMVKGYPIMAKYRSGLGLEMPLNVMSRLAGSNYANEFDGKTFIKGFSAMLIATEVSKDLLLWHYYFNIKGERISYLDHDLGTAEAISLQQLGAARHVVGWCRECNSYAGAANVSYGDIGSVYLPEPHADCILEKISLSGGKLVSGGVSFAVGVHHIPPHLTRNSYLGKLTWIATRFVVFWDERDKRGWLVNGTSALLHLVRASIQHHKGGDFSALVTFKASQIKSPAEYKPNSASQILSNPENLEVEVQLDKVEKTDEYDPVQDANGASMPINRKPKMKRTYKLFCDVVEEHYSHLEQIMDYQVQAGGQNGVKIKLRFRDHLEGWDFMELATGHDPSPRLATLDKSSYGWVNLVRSIEAITLTGSGFGEMIRPIEFDGMCPNWKTLPTQRYYLAATVFDLENIIKTKKFGGSLEEPIKLVRDLLWHSPQETVATCLCRSGSGPQEYPTGVSHHHDPVQVFYSTTWKSIIRIKGPELHSAGAIVFGHPTREKFYWKKQGDEHAEQSEPPPLLTVTHELGSTAVSAQTRASSDTAPAQVASLSSQSYERSSDVTRYTSASASATVSTPIESATDSVAFTASTTSEISSGTLSSAEQILLNGLLGGEIQETRQGEKRLSLLRKIIGRRKKPN